MSDIFISYAREDRLRVEALAHALQDEGWSVWWDSHIRAGEQFDRIIESELANAQSVLVVWTHHSVESDWVRAEAGSGLARGILVSVVSDPGVDLPLRFTHVHHQSLAAWNGDRSSPDYISVSDSIRRVLQPGGSTVSSTTWRKDENSNKRETAASPSYLPKGRQRRISQVALALIAVALLPFSFILADSTIHTPDILVNLAGISLWAAGTGGAYLFLRRWF